MKIFKSVVISLFHEGVHKTLWKYDMEVKLLLISWYNCDPLKWG